MIKYLQIILISLLLTVALVQGETLDSELVRKAGETWLLADDTIFKAIRKKYHLVQNSDLFFPIQNLTNKKTIAYVYQLEPTGFVILSNDNHINPVLAFSNESRFFAENIHQNTLLQMIRADLTIRFKALEENRISPATILSNQQKWFTLLNMDFTDIHTQSATDIVGPFITSKWGQGKVNGTNVFNLYTPNNWSTGCVATAMSQILHYYRWPKRGIVSHIYNEDDAGVISANFDSTYYDWENMLDIYHGVASTQAQKEAVALLGFHCGVSLEMDYEYSGSTASTRDVSAAVSNYFAYQAQYLDTPSEEFFQQLKNEMQHKRPVQIAISSANGFGHSVVVDGYADQNNYYHMNMGWLGKNNGWYDLQGSFNASGYSIIDGAVINFTPVPVFADSFLLTQDSLFLAWHTSFRISSDKYELQYSEKNNGQWSTLNGTIQDSFYVANVNDLFYPESKSGTFYFRVRAFADSAWLGWSPVKAIKVRPDRKISFRVNMSNHILNDGDVVVRGNILPLSGYQNSEAFSGPDSNGVYEATIGFDYSNIEQLLKYRFAFVSGSTVTMESKNREYRITSDEFQFLPTVYFDDNTTKIKILKTGSQSNNFRLLTNYPNPFNAATIVQYYLQQPGLVDLELYDINGRLVMHLIHNEYHGAGSYKIRLDFNQLFSISGFRVPASGTYFVVLKTVRAKSSIKILYLK